MSAQPAVSVMVFDMEQWAHLLGAAPGFPGIIEITATIYPDGNFRFEGLIFARGVEGPGVAAGPQTLAMFVEHWILPLCEALPLLLGGTALLCPHRVVYAH